MFSPSEPPMSGPPALTAPAAPAAAMRAPAPGGGPSALPPQFQQFVKPGDPVQAAMIQHFGTLTPHDIMAISAPPVLAALKKLMPEIGFAFAALAQRQHSALRGAPGSPQGAPPRPAMPQAAPPAGVSPGGAGAPAPAPRPPQFGGPPRPQTALGRM